MKKSIVERMKIKNNEENHHLSDEIMYISKEDALAVYKELSS